ncbi:MAG: energy transducer TonB [Erythrobacter sp.]|uniref:TonB family protein n=1 Tax=Erythrobacter sp. TaxID=1042 RepID=UPI0025DD8E09|nr:TonB family protein [Erythrobacter sp.]MCM0000195.1 energy transducer TonB [Erythrobacter sp.]
MLWQPGALACAGAPSLSTDGLIAPTPVPIGAAQFTAPFSSVTVTFDLDAEGRPFSITGTAEPRARFYALDIMPALRASRFAGSGPRTGCTLTYTPEVLGIADAPLKVLARYGVAQRARLERQIWERFAEGDCHSEKRLAPLQIAYPDWRKIERRVGDPKWTYVRYDVDTGGVPVNLATVLSSGDPALDAEAQRAVAESRYAGGPRTGCVRMWWQGPETVPVALPESPVGNPACEIDDRWERAPRLTYPRPYQSRAIEGWAALRFDVAPWGEIGAVEVIEAQPSSEFGDAAIAVLRAAKFKPLDTGLKGCVDRVSFRIRKDAGEEAAGDLLSPAD